MKPIALIAVLAVFASGAAAQEDHERVLTVVKGTPTKELDSALPKLRFERWLQDVVGNHAELRWELNDCGEPSGDAQAGAQGDPPICAGVDAQLEQGRAFQILLVIGTQEKGIGGKPRIRSILVQAGRRMLEVKRLRDLPKAISPAPTTP